MVRQKLSYQDFKIQKFEENNTFVLLRRKVKRYFVFWKRNVWEYETTKPSSRELGVAQVFTSFGDVKKYVENLVNEKKEKTNYDSTTIFKFDSQQGWVPIIEA